MSKDAWKRFSDEGYKHYDVVGAGFKYNMMDLQAAIGIHQLARVEAYWQRRREIWSRYNEAFADLPLGLPAPDPPDTRHAYHLYTVLVDRERSGIGRDTFLDRMTKQTSGWASTIGHFPSTRTTSSLSAGDPGLSPCLDDRPPDGESAPVPETHGRRRGRRDPRGPHRTRLNVRKCSDAPGGVARDALCVRAAASCVRPVCARDRRLGGSVRARGHRRAPAPRAATRRQCGVRPTEHPGRGATGDRRPDGSSAKVWQLVSLPLQVWRLACPAMREADAIHVRCPGNLGLLGAILAPKFSERLVAKYAGQWSGFPGEPWSSRLQRQLLATRFSGPVTVYGRWPDQPAHIVPFFTSILTGEAGSGGGAPRCLGRVPQNRLEVLYVGRLSRDKNVHVLLDSVADLRARGVPVQEAHDRWRRARSARIWNVGCHRGALRSPFGSRARFHSQKS